MAISSSADTPMEVDRSREAVPHLKGGASPATLAALHDPKKVGLDRYRESLAETFHEHSTSIGQDEELQDKAYAKIPELIHKRLVDPAADIGTNINNRLPILQEPAVTTHKDALESAFVELHHFSQERILESSEAEIIGAEMQRFAQLYVAAYPDASPAKLQRLLIDNARKLTYQTLVDRTEFEGSDHGLKHILQGNMKFADEMIHSMEANNLPLTPQDKVLIHQTIIDHDIGYTVGAVSVVSNPASSSDHPLFGAKFIEDNRDYYVHMFGEDGYQAIFASILYHEYPRFDFDILKAQMEKRVHSHLIRSVTSTVDALNTTAETKTPLFFTKPDAMRVLLKLRLAVEASKDPSKGINGIDPEIRDGLRRQLEYLAESDPSQDNQASYLHAIEDFFNGFVLERTLGQYTGMVNNVALVRNAQGRLIPEVHMSMSRMFALVGNLFGGKLEMSAFLKTMRDMGITKKELHQFGRQVERLQAQKNLGVTPIEYSSGKATFKIAPHFAEYDNNAYAGVDAVFEEVGSLSIRPELRELLDIASRERVAIQTIRKAQMAFFGSITEKTTAAEIEDLTQITQGLLSSDAQTRQEAVISLRTFLTQKEKDFIQGGIL